MFSEPGSARALGEGFGDLHRIFAAGPCLALDPFVVLVLDLLELIMKSVILFIIIGHIIPDEDITHHLGAPGLVI